MKSRAVYNIGLAVSVAFTLLSGCDGLFGTKGDETTDEIFDVGRKEPGFFAEVEYVPLFPFFQLGGDGSPLTNPSDVYVGYDEFIYVTDDRGLHVLDKAGRPANFVPIEGGAGAVVQDRLLNVYVTARRDTFLNAANWNLPVVLRFADVTIGAPRVDHIIWHPFDDDTRKFQRPDPVASDVDVTFTGVSVLYDNSIYVSRRGPVNDPTSIILPHNAILQFDTAGVNVLAVPLSPTRESLRSAVDPSDVLTFVQPPQRSSFPAEKNLIVAQAPYDDGTPKRFGVLSILAIETTDGIVYRTDSEKLQVSAIPDRGDGFLYDEFKFAEPSALAVAGDNTQYVFVADATKDSVFVFTSNGIEGVAPPPGSSSTKPVVVSFGGSGDGARQFNSPQGIAYFERIVYVADTGNGRISRFRLNTDFE